MIMTSKTRFPYLFVFKDMKFEEISSMMNDRKRFNAFYTLNFTELRNYSYTLSAYLNLQNVIYSQEDIFSEILEMLSECRNKYDRNKGASFYTLLNDMIQKHFCNVRRNEYRRAEIERNFDILDVEMITGQRHFEDGILDHIPREKIQLSSADKDLLIKKASNTSKKERKKGERFQFAIR